MSLLRELPEQNDPFLSDGFFHVAVQHFPYMKDNKLFTEELITGLVGEIYKGDFHGLLTFLKIPFKYHRVYTAFNGLKSSMDFDGLRLNVMLPDARYIEKLKKIFYVET